METLETARERERERGFRLVICDAKNREYDWIADSSRTQIDSPDQHMGARVRVDSIIPSVPPGPEPSTTSTAQDSRAAAKQRGDRQRQRWDREP